MGWGPSPETPRGSEIFDICKDKVLKEQTCGSVKPVQKRLKTFHIHRLWIKLT